jgi:hypothetical protein
VDVQDELDPPVTEVFWKAGCWWDAEATCRGVLCGRLGDDIGSALMVGNCRDSRRVGLRLSLSTSWRRAAGGDRILVRERDDSRWWLCW